MNRKRNIYKLIILAVIVLLAMATYMTIGVKFHNERLMRFAFKIRYPKLIAMVITAFTIGGASIVFQSVINNTIVTPCLLGMNSLYTLIHTAVVFFLGSGSMLVINSNMSFALDLVIMGVVATFIYSYLFKVTNHNVLYVLLIGTVLTSFFSSIQSTLTRIMDPNEYDTLLTSLVASFSNVNSEIIIFSLIIIAAIIVIFGKELAMLDVLTLGKEQAVNLGVDYDRCIRRLLLAVTLCISVATAMVGPISFLGLIIANLSRQMLKTYRHTQLILGSALFGMIGLIFGQLIVERIFVYAIPVSVFITVGGGIYFLYLFACRKESLILRRRTIMVVDKLLKKYDKKVVVDSVSFSIPKGKVTSFIGPNGAGKSTVMGMISRLIANDAGIIEFQGKSMHDWKKQGACKASGNTYPE